MRSKYAVKLFAVLFLLVLLASPLAAQEPAQEGEYYMIGTAEELEWFRDAVNGGSFDANAKLTADIDLGGVDWIPIGDGFSMEEPENEDLAAMAAKPAYFGGEFDGQGHTVSNFKVTGKNDVGGFFGFLLGSGFNPLGMIAADADEALAVVKNLHIKRAVVSYANEDENGGGCLGAIAGEAEHALIENCTVTESEISALYNVYAGGVVGKMSGATVALCRVTGTALKILSEEARAHAELGGITGYSSDGSFIKDSAVNGCTIEISAPDDVAAGGIAGDGSGESYENVRAIGNTITVSATQENGEALAGGIRGYGSAEVIGALSAYNTIKAEAMEDCGASGIGGQEIYGSTAVGNVISAVSEYGDTLAGGIAPDPRRVFDSSVYGGSITVESKSTDGDTLVCAGGITGNDGYLENCSVSELKISATANESAICAGGIAGFADDSVSQGTVFGGTAITVSGGDMQYVGGLIGALGRSAEITESVAASVTLSAPEGAMLGAVAGYKKTRGDAEPSVTEEPRVDDVWYLDTIAEDAIGDDEDPETTGDVTTFAATDDPETLDAVTYAIDKIATILKGKTETLSVVSFPGTKDAFIPELTWTLNDTSVATLEAGENAVTVTGAKTGSTRIAFGNPRVPDDRIIILEDGEEDEDDDPEGQLVSAVFVVDPDDPWHSGSSNCSALPGLFGLLTLAALPFVAGRRRK